MIGYIKKFLKNNYISFLIVYSISIIIYQFFINNMLVNTEDTIAYGSFWLQGAWDIILGRYFTAITKGLFLGINSEPINTLISIFFTSLSIYIVFNLFDLDKKIIIFLSILCITSTVNYYILSHRYSSIAASLQIFFASLSISSIIKIQNFKRKLIISIFFLVTSLALGQYSLAILPLVFLFYIIYKLISIDKLDYKYLINLFIILCISVIVGVTIYRISWLLLIKILNLPPTDYLGADSIGFLNIIKGIPSAFINSYIIFYQYFTGQIIKFNGFGAYFLYTLLFIIYILSIIIYSIKYNKKILILVGIVLPIILLPSILSITIYMTPSYQKIRPHQMISFTIFIPLLFIILYNIYKKIHFINLLIIMFAIILLHCQVLQMSIDFDTMYRSNKSTSNIINLILSRLDNERLFGIDKNIYFYGSFSNNELYYTQTYKDRFTNLDKVNYRFLIGSFDHNYSSWKNSMTLGYIRYYMGININMNLNANFDELFNSDEFLVARPFPSSESIFTINDNDIIVKVSD